MHVQQVMQQLVTCHNTASKQPNLPLNTADCQIAAVLVGFAHGLRVQQILFGFPSSCFAVVMLNLQPAASYVKTLHIADMTGAQV